MKKLLLALLILHQPAMAKIVQYTKEYDKTFRTTRHERLQVIIETQPSWCHACKLYEPVIKDVANDSSMENMDFVINNGIPMPESPGYIPWTYIYTNAPTCRTEVQGYVPFEVLRDAVRNAYLCELKTRAGELLDETAKAGTNAAQGFALGMAAVAFAVLMIALLIERLFGKRK